MKNYLLLFALLISCLGFAQENEMEEDAPVNLKSINNKKHEFRIDVLEALVVPALEVNYEYVLSKYSGFGAAISYTFSDDGFEELQRFAISPYFRQYFFNKKDYGARGFYAEGLLRFATGEKDGFETTPQGDFISDDGNWSQFGVGFALGQKWVSRNGFVIDLSAGLGRYFGASDSSPEFFLRGGLNVGYRF